MPSIINGLFAGRSGIASHGSAIAVVGDNISNASTIGFKSARAEFEDLIAGGQASGQVTGAGSSVSSISSIFQQGTLEFTSRPLDLAIDGNGFFAVADGQQRFYTRAGNFKVDAEGFIVNQNGLKVLGLPANGTGALEEINVNTVSQDTVASTDVSISGNLNAAAPVLTGGAAGIPGVRAPGVTTGTQSTFAQLNEAAEFSTVVQVFDTLGAKHTVTMFFFHTQASPARYVARAYVDASEVEATGTAGEPRQVGTANLDFNSSGQRTNTPVPPATDFSITAPWVNGASTTRAIGVTFEPFTQYAASSNVQSITQDGQGIGTVTSLDIDQNGTISALLDNGQQATIGIIGLVNFSNPEGLTRVGNQLLSQSTDSGEPVIGTPLSGTLGAVQAGSLELSTVDIASEFVKLITLQRGFQANSRIITTINQLLNDIIQLA